MSFVDDLKRYGASQRDLDLGIVKEGHPAYERYYAAEMRDVTARCDDGEFTHEIQFQRQLIADYKKALHARDIYLDLTPCCYDSVAEEQLTWRALMDRYSRSLWVIEERWPCSTK